MTPAGFPHSEISGSKHVNNSPKLIAAFHVLHRLPMPRHPPLALNSLFKNLIKTKKFSTTVTLHFRYFPVRWYYKTPVHHTLPERILYYSTIQLSKIKNYQLQAQSL